MKIGDKFREIGAQLFRLVGVRNYVRQNGRPGTLYEIEAPCPDCGKAFRQTVSSRTVRYLSRRCNQHRRPGLRVPG